MSSSNILSFIHPDEFSEVPPVETNFATENLDNSYISTDDTLEYSDESVMPPSPPAEENRSRNIKFNGINLGDGNMSYIPDKDSHSRIMLENAWHAITQTETWNFVAEPIESFMFSNDNMIWVITAKMEELGYKGHSGFSFGWTMRQMQYLAQNGVEKFKEGYIKKKETSVPQQRTLTTNRTQSPPVTTNGRAQPPSVGTTSTFGNMTLVFGGSIP